LWLIAASGAGHHRDPEGTFLLMREAADASPVLRPGDPWTDDQLRRMAHRAVDRKSERDRRDLEMTREWGRPIMWTEP
jgi:hypothetical protein